MRKKTAAGNLFSTGRKEFRRTEEGRECHKGVLTSQGNNLCNVVLRRRGSNRYNAALNNPGSLFSNAVWKGHPILTAAQEMRAAVVADLQEKTPAAG